MSGRLMDTTASGSTILAVAPNPALDRVARAEGASGGGIVRASAYLDTPGGKGTHVAIVASELGRKAVLLAPLGGPRGKRIAELLGDFTVELAGIPIEAETRGTYTVIDPAAREAVLEVIEPSPVLTDAEALALGEELERRSAFASVVVGSGSLPDGLSEDFYARTVDAGRRHGATTIIDTSGSALSAALESGPDVVVPNLQEAGELLQTEIPARAGYAELALTARAIQELGARTVLFTLGAKGSLLLTSEGEAWSLTGHPAKIVNDVGCGDALVGGLAVGLAQGMSHVEAARMGTAAAIDKIGRLHPCLVDGSRVRESVSKVTCERIHERSPRA
jgi:1-phosphofructokinase family hexose kinase